MEPSLTEREVDMISIADSILSMSVPSTGPQSLLDTCSTLSDTAETSSTDRRTDTSCWTDRRTDTSCWTLTAPSTD